MNRIIKEIIWLGYMSRFHPLILKFEKLEQCIITEKSHQNFFDISENQYARVRVVKENSFAYF